jgi:NTP pyrophosphatase (non-canonical NTP hydrolase)
MEENEKLSLYRSVLGANGIAAQQMILIEESGELLDAVAKSHRNRATRWDIITELADVHIMVEQMAVFYGLDDFRKEKERKLQRLKCRLQEHLLTKT